MSFTEALFELARLAVSAAGLVVSVVAAFGGVLLGSWLSGQREARRRRLLARPVAALFREEIEQLVDFYSAEGAKSPFKLAPGTPTHDEHGRQLVEILEAESALAISRFYRALSAVEHARSEERSLYGALEGPGVSDLRSAHAAVVEQRIAALRKTAEQARDSLQLSSGGPA